MKHTHFADVNGMPDPQHYTTAGDLAILSTRLIRDFPDYYNIFSVKDFTYNKIKQPNRNRLLWIDPTVDGLKTGHTQGRRLLPDRDAPSVRWPGAPDAVAPSGRGDDGRAEGTRPRARQPEDAELRLYGLRHGASVQGRPGHRVAARLQGRGRTCVKAA